MLSLIWGEESGLFRFLGLDNLNFCNNEFRYVEENKPAAQAAGADPFPMQLQQQAKSTHLAKSLKLLN